MGLIQRLPQEVVNRMAAGEVLARPYNAIKELVENSLDAGATEIQVHMQKAGLQMLQVSDNGKGIEREDFELVCERFATSKLEKFEDLMHMKTYGFRGEALASLSHVARVNIVSKRADAKCAFQADFLDGKMLAPTKPAAGKTGTCITATDLFYNLPTRRNKMTTHGEEAKMVYDTLLRFAVHRPDVSFALRQSQSSDFRTKGDGNYRDVVSNLMGRGIADTLVPLALESSRLKFKFSGHLSKPLASATSKNAQTRKTSRSFFSVFINGRSVRCDILKQPIDEVLNARALFSQFCALHLEIDETRIDVNVHPTKSSVIFLEKEEIVEEIRRYFESFVDELFGITPTPVENFQEEETKSISFSQKIPIFTTQSIKSIESLRKKSENSNFSPNFSFKSGKNEKKRVDYMEVRTDAKERTIDEFIIRCPIPNTENEKISEKTGIKRPRNEENEGFSAEFEEVSMVSMATGRNLQNTTHREFNFESLESLRKQIVSQSSLSLRELIKTSTFVGSIDPETVLIQFGTSLYKVDFCAVLREFFYQISIFSFGNYGSYRLEHEPPMILELLEIIGKLGKEEEKYKDFVVFDEFERRIQAEQVLAEHLELLYDYFAIKIEWKTTEENERRLYLTEIPSLVHHYVPQLEKLPFLIGSLIMDVDYDDEKQCFEAICRAIGELFAIDPCFITSDKRVSEFSKMCWKPLIKQILMPLVKRKFIPPDSFRQGMVFKQLADCHELYKVFERCGS